MEYDAARMANFGRDTARAYASFTKAQERMASEINTAVEAKVSLLKIAHDVMGRCPDREAQINLLSVIYALVKTGKIPEGIYEPFVKGIKPRRV